MAVPGIRAGRRAAGTGHTALVRVLPYGERAVLLELYDDERADPGAVRAWDEAVRRLPGVLDTVPAAQTLLVVSTASALSALVARLRALRPSAVQPRGGPLVTLPVYYDGPDLDEVAKQTGHSPQQVVALHAGASYVVAFCGFAPGFGYLSGLPPALHLPRRLTPRTRVPAGAVAVADCYSAVYPRASPGGWHLLGRTDARLFDPARTPPALLEPGTRVRFLPQWA